MLSGYNRTFDSLRGWAAFGVVGVHCNSVIPFGWVGLLFFYVLSGYLVGRSWVSISQASDGILDSLGKYFSRRVLRIFPLYYFYVGFLVFLAWIGWILPYFWDSLPSLLFGYLSWEGFFGRQVLSVWFSHLWSISVELQFYLALPLFFLLVRPDWRVPFLWGLVCLTPFLRIFLWYCMELRGIPDVFLALYTCPLTYLDAFSLGFLIVLSPLSSGKKWFGFLTYYSLFLGIFWVVFCLIVKPSWFWAVSFGISTYFGDYGQWWWGYTLLHFFFYFLIGWVSSGPKLWWIFDNCVTQYLGEISYGIYVYHMAPTAFLLYFLGYAYGMENLGVPFWVLFLAYGIAVGFAALSAKFIERPFLRIRDGTIHG